MHYTTVYTRLGGFLLQEAFLLYKEGEAKIE